MSDAIWMARAIQLAEKARGQTSPNPMVGAVLVKNGQVVGESFHQKAGLPHAEIEALRMAGSQAEGATLYVNLEPCCIHGRTPPCTDALIQARIKRVVAAMLDPNPRVNGHGAAVLREAGIEVEVGLLEREARKLNEVFVKWVTTKFPFVVLKCAMTLDGKMATAAGESRWITSEKSRKKGRELRGWYDAVLVGINTVLADDPLLTSRISGAKNPVRIVLDSRLRIPLEARILSTLQEAITWIVCGEENPDKRKALQEKGAEVFQFPGSKGKVDLTALCRHLGQRDVTSLLVEGGAHVHGSFLREGLADKLVFFIAPKLLGNGSLGAVEGWGKASIEEALRLRDIGVSRIDEDLVVEGYVD